MKNRNSEELNDVLRGEISALETYKQVLDKVGDEPGSLEVRRMYDDHREAVSQLKRHIAVGQGKPADGSGLWGAWAKTVTGTAKIFGDRSALKALKEGEEHGLKQYESALEKDIDPSLKTLIERTFIPQQRQHISSLDALIDRVAS